MIDVALCPQPKNNRQAQVMTGSILRENKRVQLGWGTVSWSRGRDGLFSLRGLKRE